MKDLRPSPIAGTWYPENPDTLRQSLDRYFENAASPPIEGKVIGIVTPHAGHVYSGAVAAYAFRCLENLEPDLVAVLSPLHSPHPAQVLTSGHEAYMTPFGEIDIDLETLSRLEDQLQGLVQLERIREDQEHALEIELPFLQRVLSKPFRLLPLMIWEQTQSVAEILGHALSASLKNHNAVLVASSDLSHFYPAAVAESLDRTMLSCIETFEPGRVFQAEDDGIGFACGRGAIAATLWAAKDLGANAVKSLAYAHSGDITGDNLSVVGYGAAVIFRSNGSTPATDEPREM
jgi:AmmeMemoRadiSam system protein B